MEGPVTRGGTLVALAGVVIALCVTLSDGRSQVADSRAAEDNGARKVRGGHLGAQSTIGDLLRDPAFAGFARLLLPWDDRAYDEHLPLSRVDSLLPYHTHVDPRTVVAGLNRLIDDAADGKTVFFRFHTEAQTLRAPSTAKTGLFFFRGRPGAPFAVVAPGGGFSYVASVHEGFPYAVAINSQGYNAFVLKYRAGQGGAVATEDMAAAISYILANAASLGVSTMGYSLWGSSAGARMAAAIGSHGVARFGGADVPKPSAVVTAYTGHSDVASNEPPTFVVVGDQDGIAPPAIMKRRVEALRRSGTTVEYHEYPGVGHGFGLGTGTSADGWVLEAIRFWKKSIPSMLRE